MRRVGGWVIAAAVGLVVLVGLWSAATEPAPASVQDRAREISQSLRCPTCVGESIADSAALLSDAMRQTVEQQVREGRSADEIRAWFADRYGQQVLLDPPLDGSGWLLWAIPLTLIGAAVVVLVRRGRPTRRWLGAALAGLTVAVTAGAWVTASREDVGSRHAEHEDVRPLDAVAVLSDAVAHVPGDVGLRLALANVLEQSGDVAQAVEEYAVATRLQPLDADTRYRHAFALVRDGDEAAAVSLLEETLSFRADHPSTLLLLGALLRGEDPERSQQLLARFAELEPGHPAAEQVTDLIGEDGGTPLTEVGQ